MAFLAVVPELAVGVTEVGTELYAVYQTIKNFKDDVIIPADNLINTGIDFAEALIQELSNETKLSPEELKNIDYTPNFELTNDAIRRILGKVTAPIQRYGNFCGINWTNNKWDTGNNIDEWKKNIRGVDELDEACRNHDFQYNLTEVPRYSALSDAELISKAESIMERNPGYNQMGYLRNLISLFKKKLFLDIVQNGTLPTNITLPTADDYFNNRGVYTKDNTIETGKGEFMVIR